MRLSQYVHEKGIDSFNADDFRFIGSKLATKPDRLVLVGGQAIETWGLYFGVMAPTGEHAPLTEDVDFLGGKEDAKWLCSMLGKHDTELILNKDFDPRRATGSPKPPSIDPALTAFRTTRSIPWAPSARQFSMPSEDASFRTTGGGV